MKSVFCVLMLSLGFTPLAFAESGNLKITPGMLRFDYAQSEGGMALDCVARIEDAQAQNWIVQCGSPSQNFRKYRVHLWVTRYERPVAPEQSYEVLYWVTDLSPHTSSAASASSTTVWFNFERPSRFTQIEMRLGVENDNAGLHLIILPSPARRR